MKRSYYPKDLAVEIAEVALDTGYDFEFLAELIREYVEDGEELSEAMETVFSIAYEKGH